jgi:hypothetical protein
VDYVFNGKALLAGVLGWGQAHLERVIRVQEEYKLHEKRKKYGGIRTISVPHPKLKKFQRRFLKYFLYRIYDQQWIDPRIRGFLPGHSSVENARLHAGKDTAFVVRFDLKDAFPSVNGAMVRTALKRIISAEALKYQTIGAGLGRVAKSNYPRPPLFSTRKVKWFRKLFRREKPNWLKNVEPDALLEEFLDVLIPLVTHQDSLPQGASTSPFLLNLVLSHYGLPRSVEEWFSGLGITAKVSVYADDFTVSFPGPVKKETVELFIETVESEGLFRFNREKTVFFDRRQIAPMITGLRLVAPSDDGLGPQTETVGVPKSQLRMIRGLIHRARTNTNLGARVEGYIAYLKGVYGLRLPRQIAVPYQRYREGIQQDLFADS